MGGGGGGQHRRQRFVFERSPTRRTACRSPPKTRTQLLRPPGHPSRYVDWGPPRKGNVRVWVGGCVGGRVCAWGGEGPDLQACEGLAELLGLLGPPARKQLRRTPQQPAAVAPKRRSTPVQSASRDGTKEMRRVSSLWCGVEVHVDAVRARRRRRHHRDGRPCLICRRAIALVEE